MEEVFFIFEILGIIAFSLSGALVAIEKKMDIFGVAIIGLITATGGGVIRDLILGVNPPKAFQNPLDALVAIVTALIVFLPVVRKIFIKEKKVYEFVTRMLDSLGLGLFTVIGVRVAIESGFEKNLFLQIFVGVLTGVGGGVLRDVLSGDRPYIFVKHFYACASLLGAILCSFLWGNLGEISASLIGIGIIFTLRLLAAHYRWSLPKAE